MGMELKVSRNVVFDGPFDRIDIFARRNT